MPPNKAFKPKPLRYAKHMAGKAGHVFRFTTLLGLTQVLERVMNFEGWLQHCRASEW